MLTRTIRIALTCSALGIGLAAGLASAEDISANRHCSARSLDGSYGFYRTGKGAFGGPLAGQGLVVFDGQGNWSALVNNVRDGEASLEEEFSGTYEVAENCTGVLLTDGAELERIIVVDDGKSYYALNMSPGATIYAVATRIRAGRGGQGR
jgi:hypothetical protein